MNDCTRALLDRLISFPNAEMCKHYAAILVIEHIAPDCDRGLVKAIIDANDHAALNLLEKSA